MTHVEESGLEEQEDNRGHDEQHDVQLGQGQPEEEMKMLFGGGKENLALSPRDQKDLLLTKCTQDEKRATNEMHKVRQDHADEKEGERRLHALERQPSND